MSGRPLTTAYGTELPILDVSSSVPIRGKADDSCSLCAFPLWHIRTSQWWQARLNVQPALCINLTGPPPLDPTPSIITYNIVIE
jgi:hypothetical protein